MEDLKKETIYLKYWPYKISSVGTPTPHPILMADINNPSLLPTELRWYLRVLASTGL